MRDIAHRPGDAEVTLDVPRREVGEGLVAVDKGEPIVIEARGEPVHEGFSSDPSTTEYSGDLRTVPTGHRRGSKSSFGELFAYPRDEATDFEVQDDHVDLETLVRDAAVLALPFQPVCEPDCPGLDPATGERRTVSTGSEQSLPADPRWAALQEFTRPRQ